MEEVEGGGGGGGPSLAIDRGGRDPVTPTETGDGGGKALVGPTTGFCGQMGHYWGTPGSLLGDSWAWG